MTLVHVPGSEWPAYCAGSWGGIRVAESLETDPQAPPWRLATDWHRLPRRERERHGVRLITSPEILAACPEVAGRLF